MHALDGEGKTFPCMSLHLKGADGRWQWYKTGRRCVLSPAVLLGQGLEHSSRGLCKGRLQSFVVKVNTPFVKMCL